MAFVGWNWNRPSSWVVVWTGLVLGAFVASGELRLQRAPAAGSPVAAAPRIVKSKAPAPAVALAAVPLRVVDALGRPVVGAELRSADGVALRSDGDGRASVSLAAGAVNDLLVTAAGCVPTWLRVAEGAPDVCVARLAPAAPWDGPAAPAPALPSVRGEGVVRDARGEPLAAAFVGVVGADLWARTDAFGRYALRLPQGEVELVVHAPGRSDDAADRGGIARTRVRIDQPNGALPLADLQVGPASVVRGIVRLADGRPAADAVVAVECAGLRRVVATGAGGDFRIGGLPAGPCRVAPFAWRGAVAAAQELSLDGRAVDVDVTLAAAEPARVRVVAEQGGAVPGAFVAATVDGLRRGVVVADADGYAMVPWSRGAEFDVRHGPAHAPLPVRRFEPEPAQLVVGMP